MPGQYRTVQYGTWYTALYRYILVVAKKWRSQHTTGKCRQPKLWCVSRIRRLTRLLFRGNSQRTFTRAVTQSRLVSFELDPDGWVVVCARKCINSVRWNWAFSGCAQRETHARSNSVTSSFIRIRPRWLGGRMRAKMHKQRPMKLSIQRMCCAKVPALPWCQCVMGERDIIICERCTLSVVIIFDICSYCKFVSQ
jgi:hypothetical protein